MKQNEVLIGNHHLVSSFVFVWCYLLACHWSWFGLHHSFAIWHLKRLHPMKPYVSTIFVREGMLMIWSGPLCLFVAVVFLMPQFCRCRSHVLMVQDYTGGCEVWIFVDGRGYHVCCTELPTVLLEFWFPVDDANVHTSSCLLVLFVHGNFVWWSGGPLALLLGSFLWWGRLQIPFIAAKVKTVSLKSLYMVSY